MDLGIEVILELFSKEGMEKIFQVSSSKFQNLRTEITDNSQRIFALKEEYIKIAAGKASEFDKKLLQFSPAY